MLALPGTVLKGGDMAKDRLDRPDRRPAPSTCGRTPAAEPSLDRGVQDHIGSKLRAMYDDLRGQPVPDRFLELLGNLDEASSEGRKT